MIKSGDINALFDQMNFSKIVGQDVALDENSEMTMGDRRLTPINSK